MRILHIITRLIVGGAQENTLLTCEGLRRRGHEVILLTGPSPGPEGTLLERARGGGYEVRVTPHLVRMPHLRHDALAYREIKRLVAEIKPDVVHTHSSKAGIIGRAAAWMTDVPTVVHTIHGLPFHPYQNRIVNWAWVVLERWAARRCDAIISVADAMTRQALAAGVGRPGQFTTIYSGMEIEPFLSPGVTREGMRNRLGIPADRVVFGTIARLQPLKGHDDLLSAAGRVLERAPGRPEAHFLWVGDGRFRERLEKTIATKGWAGHFTLTGLVPPTEVPRLIPAMDVVVHPSYREGLARALPQALLGGKPVISYDCDGAAEVCVPPGSEGADGKPAAAPATGLLVKTGDTAGLGDAMVWMAEHEPQRVAMGAAGRALALGRFPAGVMVDKIEALYGRLVASQRQRMA